MSEIIEVLKQKNLYTTLTKNVIEEICIYLAKEEDWYRCCICFFDGGKDMPEIYVCPFGCFRSYCEECKNKIQNKCNCGQLLE